MISKTVLKNGLSLVTCNTESNTYRVEVRSCVGSYSDPYQKKGLAHFIEHLLFQGSLNRKPGESSKIIEDTGSKINAYTSDFNTAITVTTIGDHLKTCLNELVEMVSNCRWSTTQIEKERKVIFQEINDHDSDLSSLNYEFFVESTFHTERLGNTLGYKTTLANIQEADLRNHYESIFTPQNLTVFVSGKITEEVVETISNIFSELKLVSNFTTEIDLILSKDSICTKKCPIGEMMTIWYSLPQVTSLKEYVVLNVISKLFSSGLSSRLFIKLREENPLVYGFGFYPYVTKYLTGMMFVAETEAGNFSLVKNAVDEAINSEVLDLEFDTFKLKLKTEEIISNENPSRNHGLIIELSRVFGLDNLPTSEEYIKEIEALTREDINSMLDYISSQSKVSISTLTKE